MLHSSLALGEEALSSRNLNSTAQTYTRQSKVHLVFNYTYHLNTKGSSELCCVRPGQHSLITTWRLSTVQTFKKKNSLITIITEIIFSPRSSIQLKPSELWGCNDLFISQAINAYQELRFRFRLTNITALLDWRTSRKLNQDRQCNIIHLYEFILVILLLSFCLSLISFLD